MHHHPINTAVTPDLNSNSASLIARPVTVVHEDGTTETVYLMQVPVAYKKKLTDHITTWYLVIGSLALTLSVILSLRQIKNGNG